MDETLRRVLAVGGLLAFASPRAAIADSTSPVRAAVASRFASDPASRLALDRLDSTDDEVDVLAPQRIDGG